MSNCNRQLLRSRTSRQKSSLLQEQDASKSCAASLAHEQDGLKLQLIKALNYQQSQAHNLHDLQGQVQNLQLKLGHIQFENVQLKQYEDANQQLQRDVDTHQQYAHKLMTTNDVLQGEVANLQQQLKAVDGLNAQVSQL